MTDRHGIPLRPTGSIRTALPRLFPGIALAVAGCAMAGPQPAPEPAAVAEARGVPGFDTRDYPGDAALAAWRRHSPYRWVGYYLPAPCHTGTTWQGRRGELRQLGWGLAVLFVGEQDWAAGPVVPGPGRDPDQPPRCTTENLTPERGRADAVAAAIAAVADGFPTGTVIYLNVERVAAVSPALAEYVSAWAGGLLDGGAYVPGLYAHGNNADELYDLVRVEFRRRARTDAPRLWVARTGGFDLRRAPTESGFTRATIWQGELDVDQTWGGVTLRIDANVADSADPSDP